MGDAPVLPKVLYLADSYLSHALAAKAYQAALRSLGALTLSPDEADVVVYHAEMRRLSALRRALPALQGRYSVGTLVWEADRLRPEDEAAVRLLDEVWTPTLFSARPLVLAHRRVYALPHVIEAPNEPSAEALARVDEWLGSDRPALNVLALMKFTEPRKNAEALVQAVRHVRELVPSLRLIVKIPGNPCDERPHIERSPGLVTIAGKVSRDSLEALFRRSHLVASAHHAEAWGLTLSDALIRRIPLIASDYSGNQSFMPRDGAFAVTCDEDTIGQSVDKLPFDRNSIWGVPRQTSLENNLLQAIAEIRSGQVHKRVERGYRAARRYQAKHLQLLVKARLQDIAARLSS